MRGQHTATASKLWRYALKEKGGGAEEQSKGPEEGRKGGEKVISTPSQAVRRMGSHLLHVPILNVVVDLLGDADKRTLLGLVYI